MNTTRIASACVASAVFTGISVFALKCAFSSASIAMDEVLKIKK